jgi:flavin-dependent dehydrogenase
VSKARALPTIDIAGAGPAGLTAAIVLARRGHRVRVFERSRCVGSRFNEDFQGIENWTSDADALAELRALGVETTWWSRPFLASELYDSSLRRADVRAQRPLFYCVRRGGAHPHSLDNALRRQAESLGVEICFGRAVGRDVVSIFAGGPAGHPTAVARGVTFELDRPALSCTILSDATPSGYTYFLAADGMATIGTVLVGIFDNSSAQLRAACTTVERLYGFRVPASSRRWTGVARFSIPARHVQQEALLAGEAAGFQDALLGFGIRIAMISGALAAIAIAEGGDYENAWRARLLPQLKASRVNRAIYQHAGFTKKALWTLARTTTDGIALLRYVYAWNAAHKLAVPVTWIRA